MTYDAGHKTYDVESGVAQRKNKETKYIQLLSQHLIQGTKIHADFILFRFLNSISLSPTPTILKAGAIN